MTVVSPPLRDTAAEFVAAWRQTRWRYPEWTLGALAVAAWLAMFTLDARDGADHVSHSGVHLHGAVNPATPTSYGPHLTMLHWTVMVIAMMVPTILPAARSIALGSRWHRRQRSQALFAMGYLTPWLLVGAAALGALSPLGGSSPRWILAAALAVAALWELTSTKVRLLQACHRVRPIPPDGWRADTSCLARGLVNAGTCLGACWALMAVMAVGDHVAQMWLMLPMTVIIVAEKFTSRPDRLVRPVAALAAVAALSTLF
jgi:predicted metal-binding membrane protein